MNNSSYPGKFSRESPYAVSTPKGVGCRICPHNCILHEGDESICRTHVVQNGKLYTIAYGNPCSAHIDPIEKKPVFHFLPGSLSFSIATAGCNFSCLNCQNREISQESPKHILNSEMFPEKVVEETLRSGCRSIAYTYSEPVAFFEYAFDTARLARSCGVKNLFISNGYVNEKPLRDLSKYLDAANIDLKSFDEETYIKLTGGRLKPVLNTLKTLKEEGVWIEITNLIIPGITDDLKTIAAMCAWLAENGFAGTPLHFSRFHGMHKLSGYPSTPVDILETARNIALQSGIQFVYIGNVRDHSAENTYCPQCKKTVIERRGYSVLKDNLVQGACKFCHADIAGVWQ